MKHKKNRRYAKYTEKEILFIREHEDGTKLKRKWIADQLGRTLDGVDHKVSELGFGKYQYWSKKELQWLKQNGQRYVLGELTDNLNNKFNIHRSVQAVNQMCKHLNLDKRIRVGWFNTTDVAKMFGCSPELVRTFIEEKMLEARRRPTLNDGNGDYEILDKGIYDFLVNYSERLHNRRVDLIKVVSILSSFKEKEPATKFTTHNTFRMRVTKEEWDTFVWQREECSRIQGNCCVNCGLQKVCESLYNKVGEYYKYFETKIYETEGVAGVFNPCVEGHDNDLADSLQKNVKSRLTMLDVKAVAPMGCGKTK